MEKPVRVFEKVYGSVDPKRFYGDTVYPDKLQLLPGADLINYPEKAVELLDKPREVFPVVQEESFCLKPGVHPGIDLKSYNTEIEYYTFDSPVNSGFEETDAGSLRVFKAEDNSLNAGVLYIPGWSRGRMRSPESFARSLSREGLDVWLMTLPFEAERTPDGYRSGELYISCIPEVTAHSVMTGVIEERMIIEKMRSEYQEKVIVLGHSLGGFVASLVDRCEESAMSFFLFTGTDMAEIVWNGSYTGRMKKAMQERDIDLGWLQSAWLLGNAQNYSVPSLSMESRFAISRGDTIISTHFQENFLRHMRGQKQVPEPLVYPGGHFQFQYRQDEIAQWVGEEVRNFME